MTLKSIELLIHLVIVYFLSDIDCYKNGVQQILWRPTSVKLELFFYQED
jgi:hypothetical protein